MRVRTRRVNRWRKRWEWIRIPKKKKKKLDHSPGKLNLTRKNCSMNSITISVRPCCVAGKRAVLENHAALACSGRHNNYIFFLFPADKKVLRRFNNYNGYLDVTKILKSFTTGVLITYFFFLNGLLNACVQNTFPQSQSVFFPCKPDWMNRWNLHLAIKQNTKSRTSVIIS